MTLILSALFSCATASPPAELSEIVIGGQAPTFSLTDLDGKTWSLEAQKGKTVVLEWFNPGCPFVVAAHESGPLVDLATRSSSDVVWVAVNSGSAGKQGADPAENREAVAKWSMKHPVLLDPDGKVGRAYHATSTPQIVVIDPAGKVAYNGALDNAPLGKVKGDARQDHAANAIAAVVAGKVPSPAQTQPYGCSVKY